MRVLLPGYWGARNSGDSATLAAIIQLIEDIFPNSTYLLQSYHFGEMLDVEKYITAKYEIVWFDSFPNDINLVVIANAGVPGGFLINTILSALDRKIPIIATCLKTGMEENSIYCQTYKAIIPEFKLAMCRLLSNTDSWNRCGFNNVQYGSDLAVYNQKIPADLGGLSEKDFVVCTPRKTESIWDLEQSVFYHTLLTNNKSTPFLFISFAHDDQDISNQFRFHPNARIIEYRHFEFPQVMDLISKAKGVINTGRFHSTIYSLDENVPCCLVTNKTRNTPRVTKQGGDPNRFIEVCIDYNVPILKPTELIDINTLFSSENKIRFDKFHDVKKHTKNLLSSVLKRLGGD